MRTSRRSVAVTGPLVAGLAVLTLAACGGGGGSTAAAAKPTASASKADPMDGLVGAGCEDYARQMPAGQGSLQGMSNSTLVKAASNNPMLTTLTAAVTGKLNSDVDLQKTLESGEFTVFAPVDDAFEKISRGKLARALGSEKLLNKVLTYHVLVGRMAPDQVDGKHETMEGETLRVSGAGNGLKVNGAPVICGGIRTENATIYLINTVLIPPSLNK
ncbi:fasciclin domain-containing protein [Spongisporangium articulatum]|uniref:Fasciclin domain-containing protein n=1 Tax=Spongisporangium articulatum TaxID=3362603 RepID=A0ABW8APJ1_9ACTN